ncbi:MAG: ABC-type sugar transport system, periplasmic component, partial [Firmicutes bacterium]|nr:ABC-type sugar transport system, periplasmic component [Bacillota bacterium]
MNLRKASAAILSTVVAASVIAGCSGVTPKSGPSTAGAATAPAGQKVDLEFWGWWSSATRMPTINKLIDQWNQKNPNIHVKYTFVPFDQIMTKYLASVAAGNPPAVVASPELFTVSRRAQKKQAMDLSALGADSLKDQYYPQLWNAAQFNGKAYALPWVGETKYLYYNKDMFKEVGLDPEKGPVSWDDLQKFADKLDKKEGGKYTRIGFHPLLGNFSYNGWVWNAGGQLFKDEQPTINTDKNAQVLDWIKQWTDRYGYQTYAAIKGNGSGGPQNPFMQGKVAMVAETATWEGELKKNAPNLKYGVVPVPTPDGKQHQNAAYSGGFAVEIPVGSKHPKEAFDFAKYWTTEAAVTWAQEQNDFPAYNKATETITTPEFKRMADNMKNTGLIPLPIYAPNDMDTVQASVDDVVA